MPVCGGNRIVSVYRLNDMKMLVFSLLAALVIAGFAVGAVLLTSGSPDDTKTTPTLIGDVQGQAWSQMMDQLDAAASCETAETVRSNARAIINEGEQAGLSLETLRALGERRAAEDWLSANCG
ncbi:MAG: hypothetical protein BMS9Abin17_0698 [Acidimicrobiia bacterium]|nr:MAG: hypothetical protein BMS9Abin17_0698 [Acidimicrobiia bacterium]